jgi:DNA-binding response OmpR family regulator
MKILHVEDVDTDADLVGYELKKLGWTIVRAISVAEAILRLERNGYACILLDFGLPDAQGIEAVIRLRKHFGNIPIVGHSGGPDPRTMPGVRDLGLYDVVPKGFLVGEVIERAIRAAVAEHEVDRTNESHSRILTGLKKLAEHRPKDTKEGALPQ